MRQLNLSYESIQIMPWEYFEWFFNRQTQYLIDKQKEENEKQNKFG